MSSSAALIKAKSFIYQIIQSFYDIKPINLNNKINQENSINNFDNFLSIYGLNPNSNEKLWNKFLLFIYCFGFLRVLMVNQLDPVSDYKYCLCAGDVTLLFKANLRKSLNLSVLLTISYAIHLTYLFVHHPNTEWFEVFKCLDGSLSPKSIGIKNNKILEILLILTKLTFNLREIINFGFNCLVGLTFLVWLLNRILFQNDYHVICLSLWIPFLLFNNYLFGGSIYTANVCFNMICFYCLINAKYYNKLINDCKLKSNLKYKKFIIKWKLKCLIKQQNEFAIKILKYNKFWGKYFLIMMLHLIPVHIISVEQTLFGGFNLYLNLIHAIVCIIITIFIIFSCLFVCLLNKEMKSHSKRLIQLEFNPYLNLDINTKLKVRQLNYITNL